MKQKIISSLTLLGVGIFFAHAQTTIPAPKLFITWKAESYAPADFSGKILPTANSPITASVELIDNGKVINLVQQSSTVYWYLNDNFLQGGKALQEIAFRAPDAAGGTLDLRAEIPNYRNGPALKTVTIPIAQPETVIEAPFPSGIFSSPSIELTALPYFFNMKDLSRLNFDWSVNGETPTGAENPQKLTIKAGSAAAPGSAIQISLNIRNPLDILQVGSKTITLTYQP